jgi:hypothetical protein
MSEGVGLTLSKIDYIFDATRITGLNLKNRVTYAHIDATVAAMDLTQAQVEKLCTDTNTFVINEALNEIEFEAEENEVTLNLNKSVTAGGRVVLVRLLSVL